MRADRRGQFLNTAEASLPALAFAASGLLRFARNDSVQRGSRVEDLRRMTGPLRITAELEGEAAALALAAALDDLAGAVAAFELREAAGDSVALWRVEAYPRTPTLDPAL